MFLRWWEELFREVFDFFGYYSDAGGDLLGEAESPVFWALLICCWISTAIWVSHDAQSRSLRERIGDIKSYAVLGVLLGSLFGWGAWVLLSIVLGFLFAPVRT